jgi:type IV pilus biogenesis protein CpaD/CtpE
MRRMKSLLVVLTLALVGCASDPDAEPAPPASAARTPQPLTAAEVSAYKQELSQVFARKGTSAVTRSASGGHVAQVEGFGNVALVKFDGAGGLATTCADNEEEAVRFLTTNDGLEVR